MARSPVRRRAEFGRSGVGDQSRVGVESCSRLVVALSMVLGQELGRLP